MNFLTQINFHIAFKPCRNSIILQDLFTIGFNAKTSSGSNISGGHHWHIDWIYPSFMNISSWVLCSLGYDFCRLKKKNLQYELAVQLGLNWIGLTQGAGPIAWVLRVGLRINHAVARWFYTISCHSLIFHYCKFLLPQLHCRQFHVTFALLMTFGSKIIPQSVYTWIPLPPAGLVTSHHLSISNLPASLLLLRML